ALFLSFCFFFSSCFVSLKAPCKFRLAGTRGLRGSDCKAASLCSYGSGGTSDSDSLFIHLKKTSLCCLNLVCHMSVLVLCSNSLHEMFHLWFKTRCMEWA